MNQSKIDTLVLSGGGTSGCAYIGVFDALFKKNILKRDLSGIKEIITTSVGILFSYLYMTNLSQKECERVIMDADIYSLLNTDNLTIDDLLIDFGLFETNKIREIMHIFTKHLYQSDDITLKELYDKKPIQLTVKVYNSTTCKLEYISYKTHPDLSLLTLTQMTTAIPFFFKPVKYNDCLYVDGGMRGHFPLEACQSKNYLGIFIRGGTVNKESELIKLFPILYFIYTLFTSKDVIIDESNKHNIIDVTINHGLNFNITDEMKQQMIKKGYDTTLKYIDEYLA